MAKTTDSFIPPEGTVVTAGEINSEPVQCTANSVDTKGIPDYLKDLTEEEIVHLWTHGISGELGSGVNPHKRWDKVGERRGK